MYKYIPHFMDDVICVSFGQLEQRLEVLDELDRWREAFITGEEETRVQIHYKGFTAKFDEWIPRDSRRIRPYGR